MTAFDSHPRPPVETPAGHRIEVVDDDADFADSLADMLALKGFVVRTAENRGQALALAESFEPEVAFIDIRLGSENGLDLIGALRDGRPNLICISVTGHAEIDMAIEALRQGADDFLLKPVAEAEVDAVLERGFDRQRMELAAQVAEQQVRTLNAQLEERVAARTAELTLQLRERERADVALRESEGRLRTLMDSIVDAIVVVDEQGRIESANPATARIFGHPVADIIGRDVSLLMPEPHRSAHDRYLADYRATGNAKIIGFSREVEGLRQDGSTFPMDLAVSEVMMAGRRNFIGVIRDITDRKQNEQALRIAKEQADTASNAKTEFLSRMSHELRTPMNAILGFGQLLEFDPTAPLNDSQAESVRQILKSGHHLLDLINEVLDFAQIETGQASISLETVAVHDVVAETLRLAAPLAAGRGIELIDETADVAAPQMRADYTRLKQVLLNLLSNAVKYNRDGGTVSIKCEETDDNLVRISISDTGFGIPEDRQSELFQPFSRLGAETRDIEGAGMGLTITKQLVERMNGQVGFRSAPGLGSTFWLALPAAVGSKDARLPAPGISSLPGDADGGQRSLAGTILYVEDNPPNLNFMREIFRRVPDITMLSADNAERGLEMAERHLPDVILMDINLPGMSGMEAIKRIRGSKRIGAVPVIAVSANAMAAEIKKALAAGFDRYLTKPVKIEEIMATMEAYLETPS
ncbi:MAG: response regulator [Alphaproteobacteria bacterium]|nr:response regulator [Alphaproteobacteria bacterium]MDP6516932.1 response regulator [Alphaproteobacteria bacterium]